MTYLLSYQQQIHIGQNICGNNFQAINRQYSTVILERKKIQKVNPPITQIFVYEYSLDSHWEVVLKQKIVLKEPDTGVLGCWRDWTLWDWIVEKMNLWKRVASDICMVLRWQLSCTQAGLDYARLIRDCILWGWLLNGNTIGYVVLKYINILA